MTNELAEPGRLHNQPPISEIITETLAPLLSRRNDLLQVAETAKVIDNISAAKVIDLSEMIRAVEDEAEAARKEMKAPHLAATRAIDAEFGAFVHRLTATREKLRDLLTAYQREHTIPDPVRAQLGSLGARREIAFDITDARKLCGWMLRQPMKGNLEQALRTIMGAYLRQMGVEAVSRGVDIPGISVWLDTQAAIRR